MSTMPERVWLNRQPNGTEELFFVQQDDGDTPYVPEQRARDAERERDEANKELLLLHAQYRQVSNLEALRVREIAALRAERDALRADLKALERAVLYYNDVRADSEAGGCWVIPPCKPGEGKYNVCAHHWLLDTARAILARVATEEGI